MQGGRDPFFGFGDPFGGFGGQRRLVSEFFGGRDPFDDPFFRSPLGGMFESSFFGSNGGPFANLHNGGPFANLGNGGPFANLGNGGPFANLGNGGPFANLHNGGPFANLHNGVPFANLHNRGPSMNSHNGGPFVDHHTSGFLEHQPQPNLSRGLVIEELNSDDEKNEELNSDDDQDKKESGQMKKENSRKHGRSSKKPIVEDSDDEATVEKKSKHVARWNDMNQKQHIRSQPEVNSFTFQSSSVSYGGANGAFYTTSMTRRSGTDGFSYEEFKEADSSTRQATHRLSKGFHDKGHSVTRKLNSDGHVDTMQTLHNLNQDELVGFEQAWTGNAKKLLPGWREESSSRDVMRSGRIGDRGGRALPCIENSKQEVGGMAGPPQHSGRGKPGVGRPSRGRSNKGSGSHQGNRQY